MPRACTHLTKTPLTRSEAIAALLTDKPDADALNQVMIDLLQEGEIEPAGQCAECGTPVFRRTCS